MWTTNYNLAKFVPNHYPIVTTMLISDILFQLELLAPLAWQESYDNAGLITGKKSWNCTGIICSLDATEEVIAEAIEKNCNLVVAHHPILFRGVKKLSGDSYPERAIIKAIKHDIAIYAIHTNLDNYQFGVNYWMAEKLGLKTQSLQVLQPRPGTLQYLITYVPAAQSAMLREALYAAGAGAIGQYAECSFNTEGRGSFRPLENAHPAIGTAGGPLEWVEETRIEVVVPAHLAGKIMAALHQAHPYETPAYQLISLQNELPQTGAGVIGELSGSITETDFLQRIKTAFGLQIIRHTPFINRPIRTIAMCGGAGSFLTGAAIAAGADAFITADVKYHEFFDADGRLLLADIGHYESEQYTVHGLATYLKAKFPTFAVLHSAVQTNPVRYFA